MWEVEVLYKYPKLYLLGVSPRKEMGPHGEREKSLTMVEFDPTTSGTDEQITVALPTALQSQMPDSWSWELATNIYVSEGVSSKVWPLNTIRLLITVYIR